MNAIAQRNHAVVIPARVEAPRLPEALAAHMRFVEAVAAQRERFHSLPIEAREEAFIPAIPPMRALSIVELDMVKQAVADMEARLRPITMGQFRAWLGPVNAAVRNPQSEEDFAIRCSGLMGLLDDLPTGAFTGDARKSLPGFFPSAADIRQAVEPGARRLRAILAGMQATQRPAAEAAPAEPRAQRTPEEIAAVKARVAAFMAERNVAKGPAEAPKVRAAYLTGEHLAEARRIAAARVGA